MQFLSLQDLAAIATVADDPTLCIADLARRLNRPYFTVNKAVKRIRDAGGWYTVLVCKACSVCGQDMLVASGHSRKVHARCVRMRTVLTARARRRAKPGSSTPYVRRWRADHPDEVAAMRESEKARQRAEWPNLPEPDRAAMLARLHAADARDYPLTLALAEACGDHWASDEDQYLRQHWHDPARDLALALGRTLWAVRGRKTRLRKAAQAGHTPG